MAMKMISVTDIGDFKLGNAENREKGTGCTVIICEEGAVGGVDVRGGGPATRETDLLRSENTVNSVNAVVLSGGSAFGLEAASGVMRELADKRIGFDVGDDIVVPIVCGASLYDLPVGDPKAFPDIYMGAQAVRNAYTGSFARGNHGAGTGATVGKLKGYNRAMKSGLGTFACGDGVIEVGAIAAVNAVGDIYNGAGNIIAGLRSEDGQTIYGTIKTLKSMVHDRVKILVNDNTSFINKAEIEEAFAAAAKQYEAEKAGTFAPAEPEAPAYEELSEAVSEEAVEPIEEVVEPIEEAVEPAMEETEVPAEEAYIEPSEEPEEEFIPETPSADVYDERYREYAEISIPAITAQPEVYEEPDEAYAEPEETNIEDVYLELAEESEGEYPDTDVNIEESDIPEMTIAPPADRQDEIEALRSRLAELTGVDIQEYAQESFEEPDAEDEAAESEPEPEVEAEPEPPAVEFVEETAEVFAEEAVEEAAYEPAEEEPVVLSREEMGYDIVFNTTISCLITNAELTKSQANKLASILHDAYARAIKPVHGTLDGDTVFVLATGKQKVNFDAFAALATDVMQYAIIDGAMSAESAYGLPAARDMQKTGE